jgi:hypothetical protein
MDSLYKTVISLASLGFAGVGLVIFLLIFILLLKGAAPDEASANLRSQFLRFGVGFAAFCGVLTLVTTVFAPVPAPAAGPTRVTITFAPDFAEENLSPPRIKLADGTLASPDKPFAFSGGMINIGIGQALRDVKQLRQAATEVAKTATAYREQRDQLTQMIAAGSTAPAATFTATEQGLKTSSQNSAILERQVADAINKGDFQAAAMASTQLRLPTAASNMAVEKMARSKIDR